MAMALTVVMTTEAVHAEELVNLLGLSEDNTLVVFTSDRPGETRRVKVTGLSGALLGIDFRPANGLL